MKKSDTRGVYELGLATDFGSGFSSTSKGFWLRVHEVGPTSLGPRGRVHKLGPATDVGAGPSDIARAPGVASTRSGPRALASYRFRSWPLRHSKGSWPRAHQVLSTSSGPRGRVHELGPATDFGAVPSDTAEREYRTLTAKLNPHGKAGSMSSGQLPISERIYGTLTAKLGPRARANY